MAAGSTAVSRGFIELHMGHGSEPTGVDGHERPRSRSPWGAESVGISARMRNVTDERHISTNAQRAGSELELSNAYIEL